MKNHGQSVGEQEITHVSDFCPDKVPDSFGTREEKRREEKRREEKRNTTHTRGVRVLVVEIGFRSHAMGRGRFGIKRQTKPLESLKILEEDRKSQVMMQRRSHVTNPLRRLRRFCHISS